MKKKTYSEKAKDLCDNCWNDYQETTEIEYVDKVIKYQVDLNLLRDLLINKLKN